MGFIEIEDYIFRISEIVKFQYNCYAKLLEVWVRNEEKPHIFNDISEEEAHYFVKEMTNETKAFKNKSSDLENYILKLERNQDWQIEMVVNELLDLKNLIKCTNNKKTMQKHIDKVLRKLGYKVK